jgi:hypothetical protein
MRFSRILSGERVFTSGGPMTKIVDIHDQLEKKKKKDTWRSTREGWIPFRKSSSAPLAVFDAPCAAFK